MRSSKEYEGFADSWGQHNSLSPFPPFPITSSKWRSILITVPPIFIDRLLRFIEHSMFTHHYPITLIMTYYSSPPFSLGNTFQDPQ